VTKLTDLLPIGNNKHYQGGSIILVGALVSPPTLPLMVEDMIDTATGALKTGWSFFGPTNENGAELAREWDRREGQATDQRGYNLRRGKASNWRMTLGGTLLYSDSFTIKSLWGLGTATTVASSANNVAQQRIKIGAPDKLEERLWAVLQQDEESGYLKADVFRKGVLISAGPQTRNAQNMTLMPFSVSLEPDPSVTDGTDFGYAFETSVAVLT
jgi:hypothetical protein